MKQITKHVSKLGILFTIGMVLAGCEGINNFMGGDDDSSIDRGGATAGEKNPLSLPSNFLPGGQDQQGMFVPEMNMVTVQSKPKMIIGSGKDGVFLENRYVTFNPYQISDTEITRGLYYFVMSTDLTWLEDNEGVVSPELKAHLAGLKYADQTPLPNKIFKVELFSTGSGVGRNIQGDYWMPEAYIVSHLPSTSYTFGPQSPMLDMWTDKVNGNDFGLKEYFFGTERDEEGNLVNPSKPMGYLQWYDAVMFCNKLSLLTGKKPAYVLTGFGTDGTPTVQKSRNPDIWRRGANISETGRYDWPDDAASQILFYQYHNYELTSWVALRGTAARDSWWSREARKAIGLKNALTPNTTGARKAGITIDPDANGYRLPTEVEWELAARGGNQRDSINWEYAYAGGDDPALVGSFLDPDNTGPQPVRSKQANSLGLYDMSGNVAEWIHEEFYELDYTSTAPQFDQNKFNRSPSGGTLVAGTNVLRGGSYRDEATRSNGDETQYLHKLTERVSYPSSGWSEIWNYDRNSDQDYVVPYANLGMRIVCNVK